MIEVKVRDWGKRLPSNGKPFSFLPFTGKKEKEVYSILSKGKSTIGYQVRAVLSLLLDEVGEVKFPEGIDARLKTFDSLDLLFGDAYYMYLCLRVDTFGDEIKLSLVCPVCKESSTYTIDISSFKILVAESGEVLENTIKLDTPITISNKLVSEVKVTPVRFNHLINQYENPSEIQNRVISLNTTFIGYDFPVAEEQVDEFDTKTIKKIYAGIDKVTPGLSEVLSFLCQNCERTAPYTLSWEYPSFFV